MASHAHGAVAAPVYFLPHSLDEEDFEAPGLVDDCC